jgi:hypothetical protein
MLQRAVRIVTTVVKGRCQCHVPINSWSWTGYFFFGSVEREVSSRCASVQKVRCMATIWQCQSVTSGSRPCQDFHALMDCVRCLGHSAYALRTTFRLFAVLRCRPTSVCSDIFAFSEIFITVRITSHHPLCVHHSNRATLSSAVSHFQARHLVKVKVK